MLWKRLRKQDQDLSEELRAHQRMAIDDRIEKGESPQDAERNARREFGNELLVRETTRDMWGFVAWEQFGQDLRYALARTRRSPGFTAIALLTLALGLGAATTVFSIVNGVLLRPLGFREPDNLYIAENIPPATARRNKPLPINARHFHEWRTNCQTCQEIALFQGAGLTLTGAGEPVKLPALSICSNFFRTLGIQPVIGREFQPEEEGTSGKVILTDALWHSRFNGDRSIVGQRIEINGTPSLVVGIMPANLRLPRGEEWGAFVGTGGQPLIFRPLTLRPETEGGQGNMNYSSVLRLKPGMTPERATAELNALLGQFYREFKIEIRTKVIPLRQQIVRDDKGPLLLLLGAVGAVLLIVCLNIGNLMLVRTASRYREAGVRLALGASRWRLFRLVIMESLVLVLLGAISGLALAQAALKVFVAEAPISIPRLDEVTLDWHVLGFAVCLIAFATLICGIAPAWRLSRIEPQRSLKTGAGSSTEQAGRLAFREIMVSLEVALSTVLLVAGTLLMASFFRLINVEKGFEVANVVTQDISFLSPKYARGVRGGFLDDMTARFARIPGVQVVGATSQLPLLGETWISPLRDADNPHQVGLDNALTNFRFVTPGYFQAMGIPLRQGRYFEDADRDRPVAVITESAARTLWGNQNPLGRRVAGAGENNPSLAVVGIVSEVRGKLDETAPMIIYEPFKFVQPGTMSFVLRTPGDPRSTAASVRSILAAADPEMAIAPARTMEQIMAESVASRKFRMYLALTFALSALVLASLGIYGMISFSVARRTPEMGIRIALGATPAELLGLVIRQGMTPVVIGLAIGLTGAWFVSRLIASQLYGIPPNDIVATAGVAGVLLTVALCACAIPARRATKIDPLTALRME